MKKIGFCGFALATTFTGDVVLPPSVGLDSVRGKSFEPLGAGGVQLDVGGVHAGGAGNGLLLGDQSIATGGVDGYSGCGGAGVVTAGLIVPSIPQALAAATAQMSEVIRKALTKSPATLGATINELIFDRPDHLSLR